MKVKEVTEEQCLEVMGNADQVRNISVIAPVDNGKSTLVDMLVSATNIIKIKGKAADGDVKTDSRGDDETTTTGSIKSTTMSMHYTVPETMVKDLDNRDFMINIIDTPGHADFSPEVTAALRVTDGALVVVDCVEGFCVQTNNVLRQALNERIRPVVFLNKFDRVMELQMDPEKAYLCLNKTLENVNTIIAMYSSWGDEDYKVDPRSGTAVIGSGLQGWAISLDVFTRMYVSKFQGVEESKMRQRLWGDTYFDARNKKWLHQQDTNENGDRVKRAFCQLILDPIFQMYDAFVLSDKPDKAEKMLKALNISLDEVEEEHAELGPKSKSKFQSAMKKWLPAAESLLEMIVLHLPSPKKAQNYRAEMLYTGGPLDEYYQSIRQCNPKGSLMMYISKMVPTADKKGCFNFGRVFAGTVRAGMKVRILGKSYVWGHKDDLQEDKPIQRVVLMIGRHQQAVEEVPCGNMCGLVGIDKYILKSATVCTCEVRHRGQEYPPHPLKDMKYSVSPVVRVQVETKNTADLPQLVEGLKRLSKADPLAECCIEETGQHYIVGSGHLHLEICLKDLQKDFMDGAPPLSISEPVVSFRETVTDTSSIQCLASSANRHNRLFCKGAPLTEKLCVDIEAGATDVDTEASRTEYRSYLADRARHLDTNYKREDWEVVQVEPRRLWAYGPDCRGPNIIVDMTMGQRFMHELRDNVVTAWKWATKEGVLCGEQMRGVRVNIEDVTMHADAIHRGGGQIIPTARRVCYACYLTASPRLMEPVYLCVVQTVGSDAGNITRALTRRRGSIIYEKEDDYGTYTIHAHLPVAESFDLMSDLRDATHTKAVVPHQLVFDHWQLYPGDPLSKEDPSQEDNSCQTKVKEMRVRNGLKPEIPELSQFINRDNI